MPSSPPAPPVACPAGAARPVAVAVLEDEAHVRKTLESAITADPGLRLAFSAQTVAQAKAMALTNAAQVYLVDLGLPDADGRDFIRWVTENQPGASAMVVTVFGDDERIISSFAAARSEPSERLHTLDWRCAGKRPARLRGSLVQCLRQTARTCRDAISTRGRPAAVTDRWAAPPAGLS